MKPKLKQLNIIALETLKELAGKTNNNKQNRLEAAVNIISLVLEREERGKKEKEDNKTIGVGYYTDHTDDSINTAGSR